MELPLKLIANRMNYTDVVTDDDRSIFETKGFDPFEIKELADMSDTELTNLLGYCGVLADEKNPVVSMTEDEKRMAYLSWRAKQIGKKQSERLMRLERSYVWIDLWRKAVRIATR